MLGNIRIRTRAARACFLVLAATILPSCATEDWTRADTVRQIAVTAAIAADAYTTTRIQYVPGLKEANPLVREVLGKYPRTSDTWQAAGTVMLTNYLISRALPPKWRRRWQVMTGTVHGVAVAVNCDNGLC